MIKEAIILAGGLGTRLREAVPEVPKCMAPVGGRPFVSYVIDYFRMQGIEHFIFSLGYKAEYIEKYLSEEYPTLSYKTVIEEEPLGTGGAIQLAITQASGKDVLVTNGDTLYKINVEQLFTFHLQNNSECTLALKPMENFDRYGVVKINKDARITSFLEKRFYNEGLINGGVYIINKSKFLERKLPLKFSFEKEYLESFSNEYLFLGQAQNSYFIDIGIPEDFYKANKDLQKPRLDLKKIDKSWTLFLDRDGVINNELPGTYVIRKEEFVLSEGVLEALPTLSQKFGLLIIVSNQRGIGKGLMSEHDLEIIHTYMLEKIEKLGVKIDNIYYCPDVDNKSFNRKPNPGMALQALKDFSQIDLKRSIIVGNKLSDMRFGRAAGMYSVFIASTDPHQDFPHPDIDKKFISLLAFAEAL